MGTFDCWRGVSLAAPCTLPDGPVATGGLSVVATGGQPWGQASAKWSSRIRRISRTVIGLPWVECPECSITSSDFTPSMWALLYSTTPSSRAVLQRRNDRVGVDAGRDRDLAQRL